MGSRHMVPVLVCLASSALAAHAQNVEKPVLIENPGQGLTLSTGHNYIGLDASKQRRDSACPPSVLVCERTEVPLQLYAGHNLDGFWSLEARSMDTGRFTANPGTQARARGLDFNLVGRMSLAPSLNVFGRVGASYARTESAPLGPNAFSSVSEQSSFGPTYGAGMSYDFTSRLSATLEWDSHDLKLPSGQRDPVRSTNLGLQYRY